MSIEGFGGWMLGKVRMFFLTINKRVETRSLGIYQHNSLNFNADVVLTLLNTAISASVFPPP